MITPDRLFARRLYPGGAQPPLADQIVEIEDGRLRKIRAATARDARNGSATEYDIIAPGFIDLQINGAADILFNDQQTVEAITKIAEGARVGGTAHILPTFITAPDHGYQRAVAAVQEALAAGATGILGLHLEGPFLSTERPGIHLDAAIRPLTQEDITFLEAATATGPLLVTLAPECQPSAAIERLAKAGVVVFAGHSAASADQIAQAEGVGLRGATHLFNAMSQITGRAPGVVGAVMTSQSLFAGIIADGQHVDWRNVALAVRVMKGRLFLVTDAMPTLAGTRTAFDLAGKAITLADGRLTDTTGRLAGAHIDMISSVRNVVAQCGVSPPVALHMASGVPTNAMHLQDQLGAIVPGYRASLTCLSDALRVQAVIVDGVAFPTRGQDDINRAAGAARYR